MIRVSQEKMRLKPRPLVEGERVEPLVPGKGRKIIITPKGCFHWEKNISSRIK
jgi:hypothetical protein